MTPLCRLCAVIVVAAACAAPRPAVAAPGASASVEGGGLVLSLAAAAGRIDGKAYERVYAYPGGERFRLSQLDWDIKDVAAVGIRAVAAFPGRCEAAASAWGAVSEGRGMMVDRDWLLLSADTTEEWTHESRHPDTTVDGATLLDASLACRATGLGPLGVSAIVGVRRDAFRWSSRGGTFVYSDIDNGGFRDRRGTFPDGTLIEYEQTFTAPYVGAGIAGERGRVAFAGRLVYSPWARGSDRDYHVLRETLFEGDFSGGSYAELSLELTFRPTPRIFLSAALEARAYGEMVGDVRITAPDFSGTSGGAGAVEAATTLLSLGIGLTF